MFPKITLPVAKIPRTFLFGYPVVVQPVDEDGNPIGTQCFYIMDFKGNFIGGPFSTIDEAIAALVQMELDSGFTPP